MINERAFVNALLHPRRVPTTLKGPRCRPIVPYRRGASEDARGWRRRRRSEKLTGSNEDVTVLFLLIRSFGNHRIKTDLSVASPELLRNIAHQTIRNQNNPQPSTPPVDAEHNKEPNLTEVNT
ncbi:hypothetical protein GWI33_008402 [Rhynchophorus ferrugineus]|uniref:Uncharacterized protein n=1 Tax=Rhynchophorus ferrugineus TaxID=354439 RepID=A0A834MB73_RHYFE|nr:hypothetical protein GWI33_008402 [Rhynchophorus ferrugineus]